MLEWQGLDAGKDCTGEELGCGCYARSSRASALYRLRRATVNSPIKYDTSAVGALTDAALGSRMCSAIDRVASTKGVLRGTQCARHRRRMSCSFLSPRLFWTEPRRVDQKQLPPRGWSASVDRCFGS